MFKKECASKGFGAPKLNIMKFHDKRTILHGILVIKGKN
jgi:hypothetical protein